MAKNKIQRIDQEIAKVREKIAEYQDMSTTVSATTVSKRAFVLVRLSLKKSYWTPWPI